LRLISSRPSAPFELAAWKTTTLRAADTWRIFEPTLSSICQRGLQDLGSSSVPCISNRWLACARGMPVCAASLHNPFSKARNGEAHPGRLDTDVDRRSVTPCVETNHASVLFIAELRGKIIAGSHRLLDDCDRTRLLCGQTVQQGPQLEPTFPCYGSVLGC
jgi:hypothetical protein